MNIFKIKNNSKVEVFLSHFLLIWFLILIIIGCIIGGSAGDDYGMGYVVNWERSLFENNPWQKQDSLGSINVYGPLHPLMSFFYFLHPTLPKLIYMLFFSCANFYIFQTLKEKKYFNNFSNILFFFLSVPFNFLSINYVFIFGHNDSLVAGLLIFSLMFKLQNNHKLSAIFIALSILEKYYTVVLLPIILFDYFKNHKIQELGDYLLYLILTVSVVMIAVFLLYGFNLNFLNNYLNHERSTRIFSYLGSISWFIDLYKNRLGHLNYFYEILLKFNNLILIFIYLLFLLFSNAHKMKNLFSMTISLWIVLSINSGSFMTYYITMISIFLMIPFEEKEKVYLKLQIIVLPYFMYLSISSFLYLFASDAYGEILGHMRNVSGFINLFLSFFSIFMLISFYLLVKNKK